MSETIDIECGALSVTLRKPEFGYTTSINMRLHFAKALPFVGFDGKPSIWDDGTEFDNRQCKISRWLLSTDDQKALAAFMYNSKGGRGNQLFLKLGTNPSGFFPFGADLGDKGNFSVVIHPESYKEGNLLYDPLRYWENDLVFCLMPNTTLPIYSPLAAENEGDLQIGTIVPGEYGDVFEGVQHLLCPQEPFDSSHVQSLVSAITGNGTVDFVDKELYLDEWYTTIPLQMRTGNTAALIEFLTGDYGRGNIFQLTPEAGMFPFGADYPNEDLYPFNVILAEGNIDITHGNFDRFLTKLKLIFTSISENGG